MKCQWIQTSSIETIKLVQFTKFQLKKDTYLFPYEFRNLPLERSLGIDHLLICLLDALSKSSFQPWCLNALLDIDPLHVIIEEIPWERNSSLVLSSLFSHPFTIQFSNQDELYQSIRRCLCHFTPSQ